MWNIIKITLFAFGKIDKINIISTYTIFKMFHVEQFKYCKNFILFLKHVKV